MESDEKLYLEATIEAESDQRRPDVWAKAMTLTDGDEIRAKFRYVQLRVDAMLGVRDHEGFMPPHERYDRNVTSSSKAERPLVVGNKSLDSVNAHVAKLNSTEVQSQSNRPISRVDRGYAESNSAKSNVVGDDKLNSELSLASESGHTVVRQVLGCLVMLCGLVGLFYAVLVFDVMAGNKLWVVILSSVCVVLISWPLVKGGYNELVKVGFAGPSMTLVGSLMLFGQIVSLHNFLKKQGLSYLDLLNLPAYTQLFGPGAFVFLLGAVAVYLGITGEKIHDSK